MIQLNDHSVIQVNQERARRFLDASKLLAEYSNQDYYDAAIQAEVHQRIRGRCKLEFDQLISEMQLSLNNPPYCVLVKGLQFDEHYRLLVAINRTFGLLVARPFDKTTPRAQLIHHVEPQSDVKSPDIKNTVLTAKGIAKDANIGKATINADSMRSNNSKMLQKLSEELHIDGADRPKPVRFVSMQCVRPDPAGEGRSRLMDSHGFREMLREEGLGKGFIELLETHKVPRKIVGYLGGGVAWQTILQGEKICWRRYTFDLALAEEQVQLSDEMSDVINLVDEIISKNEEHVIELSMNAGDFLLVDNHRCLHARTPIVNADTPRLMYRCWIE